MLCWRVALGIGVKTMKNSPVLVAALLLMSAAAAPAFGQDFHGRVSKDNSRLTRPQEPQLQLKMDLSKVSDDGFILKTSAFDANAAAGADSWNPYQLLSERGALRSRTPMMSAVGAQSTDPVAVDYNAIERAYANAVPRSAPPRPSASASNAGFSGFIATSPWAMQAAAVNMLGANGTLLQQAGQPRVDVDNCRCDMAVPTTQCVQGRMTGFGTNVNSPPQVTMPGTGPRMMGPMMHGRTR
jgi:hypothetical protein